MIMHVIKVRGMVSGSSPGHFPPPTRPIASRLIWSSSVCIASVDHIGMCTLKMLGWGFANRLTFPLYASFLATLFAYFWHAIPSYIFLDFYCSLYFYFLVNLFNYTGPLSCILGLLGSIPLICSL